MAGHRRRDGVLPGSRGASGRSDLGTAIGIDTNGNDYSTGANLTLYGQSGNIQNTSTNGNARVTIAGPVDRVVLDYHPGNGSDGIPGARSTEAGRRIDPQDAPT